MYFLLASSTHPIYNKTKTLLQIYFPSANKRRNKLMTEHTICKESKYDKLKKKFSRIGSRIEDIFLSVALWLANILHSDKLNDWIESYTEKRMQKLQYEIIRQQWDKITLEKSLDSIRQKQNPFADWKNAWILFLDMLYYKHKKKSTAHKVGWPNIKIENPLRHSPKYTGVVFLCMATYKM